MKEENKQKAEQETKMLPEISVIIASFNEERNIRETIQRVYKTMPNCELILVEGGTDKTIEIAEEEKKKHPSMIIIHNKEDKGKGQAIKVGIAAATKPIMAQVDADSQFPPEELPELIKPILEEKADIVFASRFVNGSTIEDGSLTRMRRLANYVVSGFTSFLCGTRLTDVNAGFKAWKSDVIRDIDMQCNHFGYEPEIAIMAAKKGYTIIETPVNYKGRQRGISNVKLLRDGIIIPIFLLKTKFFR
ncbi:glycosyltransferase family 2 protein [Candidatus Woesearchaeota archaeon]|nr:glycosyltransferase family 2 protein [Candidatus Woesearchaeota archaeon]